MIDDELSEPYCPHCGYRHPPDGICVNHREELESGDLLTKAIEEHLAETPATPNPQPTHYLTESEQKIMDRALRRSTRLVAKGSDPQPTREALEATRAALGAGGMQITTTDFVNAIAFAMDRFAAQHSTAAPVSDESPIEAGIEAASEYVSSLPMGQKAWDKKEYGIAEIAAKTVAQRLAAAPVSGDAQERARVVLDRWCGSHVGHYIPDDRNPEAYRELHEHIAAALTAAVAEERRVGFEAGKEAAARRCENEKGGSGHGVWMFRVYLPREIRALAAVVT